MNKILVIILGVMMFFLSACEQWLDKELPKRQIAASMVIKDQVSAETALLGVYSYLMYNMSLGTFDGYYTADDAYRCGLLEGTNRGEEFERNLELLAIPSSSKELLVKWEECAKIVNAANNLIVGVEAVSDDKFVGDRKKEIIAEARFMRAFAQLFLMKHYAFFWDLDSEFGPLMRREPSTLSNNKMKRSGVRKAYEMILDDLDYVIEYGPGFTDVYHASKGVAMAYKVEVLLLRGLPEDCSQVPVLAEEVINNYEFKMEETYKDVFKNGYASTELMFSRYISDKLLEDADGNVPSVKKLMCGKFKLNDQFLNIFNRENDARFEFAFDSVLYKQFNDKKKILVLAKSWREDGNCPLYYMRLAQMYLFKAEALVHLNASVKDVLDPLNVLRERSGNTSYEVADFGDRDDLVRAVFNETVRELGLENGSEFFVAARLKLVDGKRLLIEYNSVYQDDKQLAWQIPDNEVIYNSWMEPNPVYFSE